MRLLFANGHLKIGGAEKSLVDILNSIDYSKHEVDLILFEGFGEYLDRIPRDVNVIMFDLTKTYGSFFSVVRKCLKKRDFRSMYVKFVLLLSNKFNLRFISLLKVLNFTPQSYDVAIAYRVGMSAEYVGYVAKASKKIMWWHHGELCFPEKSLERWRKTAKNFDWLVSVSDATKKMILPHFGKMSDDILVIPNMILCDEVKKLSLDFNPYEEETDTILVSVGRLSPEKKMINVVYAMENLLNEGYQNLKWYIVGDGSERIKIENEISIRGLQDKIICVGAKENPYPYISNSHIFVHTSDVESQGLTVLEAMALGKKSVVTRSLGVEEYVRDGKNAIVAEATIESLTEKIAFALETQIDFSDEQRKTLDAFSKENIMKKIETLLV